MNKTSYIHTYEDSLIPHNTYNIHIIHTSTVGLPRLSKISRALTLEIFAMLSCVCDLMEVLFGVVNADDCPVDLTNKCVYDNMQL